MDNAAVLHLPVVLRLICYHRDVISLGTPKTETLPLHWRASNSQKAGAECSPWAWSFITSDVFKGQNPEGTTGIIHS